MLKYGLRQEVARNIKKLRKVAKLTQEDAADSAGFHYKYYQKIESGSVNLTLDSIERVAKALGVSSKKFFK